MPCRVSAVGAWDAEIAWSSGADRHRAVGGGRASPSGVAATPVFGSALAGVPVSVVGAKPSVRTIAGTWCVVVQSDAAVHTPSGVVGTTTFLRSLPAAVSSTVTW